MRELFCKYMVVEKGMELYSDPAMTPIANRRRRGANGNITSMPGMGTLITTAIRQKDIPMVMGATLFLAVLFSFVILLVDVLYAFIDPRIKAKYQNGGKSRG